MLSVAALPVKVGCETVPFGVYVAVPVAGLTLAVLFSLLLIDTEPEGVNEPDDVNELPVKVGFETLPDGVYVCEGTVKVTPCVCDNCA
jgi:hypothetical protein